MYQRTTETKEVQFILKQVIQINNSTVSTRYKVMKLINKKLY